MKVEIWSDVMCPFCYIGKRRFESALQQFENRGDIEIEWKSFQLNPDIKTDPSLNINQYLADIKGWTLDHAQQLNGQVTQMAAQEGLIYNFDKAIIANSFKAHRFAHLAKKHGLGDKAEEVLFKAYFTDGLNIDDDNTLVQLGTAIGLDAEEIKQILESDTYANSVKYDITEAQQLGVRGVPFFVMDRKFAVSGAQEVGVFTQTLDKAYAGWQQTNPKPAFDTIEGPTCSPDGNCNSAVK